MSTIVPYVKVPLWVYRAIETGHITHDQFNVLCFAYYKADWKTLVVSSYSAENLCRFLRLDATQANLKRYRRALHNLVEREVVQYDYRRGDKRPFHLRLPKIETEEIESLYIQGVVRDSVRDSVGEFVRQAADLNPADSIEPDAEHSTHVRESVALAVRENTLPMSANNHCNPKIIEKDPLNLPEGRLLPPPPPSTGERSNAAGLEKLHSKIKGKSAGREEPLNAKQCDQLRDVALLYADFTLWLSLNQFSPDIEHVKALLRHFHPSELLLAQTSRFELGNKANKRSLAQFFYKSARPAMEAARLKVGAVPPLRRRDRSSDWTIGEHIRLVHGENGPKEFRPRWKKVIAAWNLYKGNALVIQVTQTAEVKL